MREYITGVRVATTIHMLKQIGQAKNFLVVEGDSDKRFFLKFIDSEFCHIESAENKDNVLEALTILNAQKAAGVLGVVDADFWNIDNVKPNVKNVLLTDTHDLETLLLQSSALEQILAEYSDKWDLAVFEKGHGKDIRRILLDNANIIGCVRMFSIKKNMKFDFKELEFAKFVDEKNLQVDINLLIKELLKTKREKYDVGEMVMDIKRILDKKYDDWQICCGHDMVKILLIGFKRIFGATNSKKLSKGSIEGSLRLAYSEEEFVSTKLYISVKEWETKNNRYILSERKSQQKIS